MDSKEIFKKVDIEQSNKILQGNALRLQDVIGVGWFRDVELVKKSNLSHAEVERALEQLTTFGFVDTESLNDKWCHKIDVSTEKRKKILEKQKEYLQAQIRNALDRIKLINLIIEVIDEKPDKKIEEVKSPGIEVVSSMTEKDIKEFGGQGKVTKK